MLLDRLEPGVREEVEAGGGGDVYGALLPRPDSSLEPLAVSADTALLFFSLRDEGELPRYVLGRLGDEAADSISRLVLDQVLEVRHEGGFLSGPAAIEAVGSGRPAATDALSLAALRYGQELVGLSPPELAFRLYCYGRLPISPRLGHAWADPEPWIARSLPPGWMQTRLGPEGSKHWLEWRAPNGGPEGAGAVDSGYKLYLSPGAEALRPALEVLLDALAAASGPTGFKIGAGLRGIARPDKIVVYFSQLEDLRRFAHDLERPLDGCPAHGVPFTAAITADGLLSWGADPPRPQSGGAAPLSWRAWLAERLAEHLIAASGSGVEPWRFALKRLRLAGIDTAAWIPAGGMWPRALTAG